MVNEKEKVVKEVAEQEGQTIEEAYEQVRKSWEQLPVIVQIAFNFCWEAYYKKELLAGQPIVITAVVSDPFQFDLLSVSTYKSFLSDLSVEVRELPKPKKAMKPDLGYMG